MALYLLFILFIAGSTLKWGYIYIFIKKKMLSFSIFLFFIFNKKLFYKDMVL